MSFKVFVIHFIDGQLVVPSLRLVFLYLGCGLGKKEAKTNKAHLFILCVCLFSYVFKV